MMRIRDVGEFPLIDRLEQIIAGERPEVVVGIGDDVAALAIEGDALLLATIDIQVEGIHFLRHLTSAEQLGRRALAINLSDIAAMGGQPWFALVSLALPPDTEVAWAEALYRGLRQEADQYGMAVVGGNVARTGSDITVDVALLGRVEREWMLTRAGARPADRVLVTGRLGDAGAGLRAGLDPDLPLAPADREMLLARYLTPTARVAEGALIARSGLATAMIDLSDGLSSDIGHICERSRVGVRLHAGQLPIADPVRQVAAHANEQAWSLALGGGDDYELCFTVPASAVDELAALVTRETGTAVTVVGEILPAGAGRWLVLPDGTEITLEESGWEHFRTRDPS